MKLQLAVLAAAVALAAAPAPLTQINLSAQSSSPPSRVITVVALKNPAWLAKSEQAVEHQSYALRDKWNTPLVKFGSGGWKIYLGTQAQLLSLGMVPPTLDVPGYHEIGSVPGYHYYSNNPYAVVLVDPRISTTKQQVVFDHEVIEMMVDPHLNRSIKGNSVEISDPVKKHWYKAGNGAWLDDWVYPSFYRSKEFPLDYLHLLEGK